MKVRKALSLLLCLVMLVSLVPMTAFADDGVTLQYRHGFWNAELEKNEPSEDIYSDLVMTYPYTAEYFFYLVDAQGNETPVDADALEFEGVVYPERYEGLADNEICIWPDTTGAFTVSYGEYSLSGEVKLPRAGFYTQPVADAEYFINMDMNPFLVTEENDTLYFVLTEGRVIEEFYPEGELADLVEYELSADKTYATVTIVGDVPLTEWPNMYYFRYSYSVDLPDESGGGGSEKLSLRNGSDRLFARYVAWDGENYFPQEYASYSLKTIPDSGELLYFYFGNEEDAQLLDADSLSVSDSNVLGLDWNEDYAGACAVVCHVLGNADVIYTHTDGKTYTYPVTVGLPEVGFYSAPSVSPENFITEFRYNGLEGTFYLVAEDGFTIDHAALANDYHAWPKGSSLELSDDGSYATITVRGTMEEEYLQLPVSVDVTDPGGWSHSAHYYISIYDASPGLVIRYGITDDDVNMYPDPEYVGRSLYATIGYAVIYPYFLDGSKEMSLDFSKLVSSNEDMLTIEAYSKDPKAATLNFHHLGEVDISYTHTDGNTYTLPVTIALPAVGFYSDTTASEDSLVIEYALKEGDNSLYILPEDGYIIEGVDMGDFPEGSTAQLTDEGALITIAPFVGEEKYFNLIAIVGTPYGESGVQWPLFLPVTGLAEPDCSNGHSWGEGKITIKPTETTEGELTYICALCGETKTETIPVLEHYHNYSFAAVEPGCTEDGYSVYTCACGHSYTGEYIDPAAKAIKDALYLPLASGVYDYNIEYMVTKINDLYIVGLEWGESVVVPGDEYEALLSEYFVVDDAVLAEIRGFYGGEFVPGEEFSYDAENHVYTLTCVGGFGGWTDERVYMGYVKSGERYYAYYENVSYLWLSDVLPEEVDVWEYAEELGYPETIEYEGLVFTNGPDGYSMIESHSGYGKVACVEFNGDIVRIISVEDYSEGERPESFDDKKGEATGHSWDEGKVTKEPTETAEGEKTFTCAACGETRTETIARLDHTHSYSADVISPTCTEVGYTEHRCACGDKYVDSYVEAPGHSWNSGEVTKEPTESAEGEKTFTCVACGEKKTEAIAKLEPEDKPEPEPDLPPVENTFTDVAEKDYFYEPVMWAVQKGVTTGLSAESFGPASSCTRAQVVTFLWRAAGEPAPKSSVNPFTDVSESAYYYDAVLWAVEEGITTGLSATTFGPNTNCTRGQIVTFMYRAAGEPEVEASGNPFADVRESDYYYVPVMWAVDLGVTTGMTATSFAPASTCTRGQIVTFLFRYFA